MFLYKLSSHLLSKQVRRSQAESGITEISLGSGTETKTPSPQKEKEASGKMERNRLLFLFYVCALCSQSWTTVKSMTLGSIVEI